MAAGPSTSCWSDRNEPSSGGPGWSAAAANRASFPCTRADQLLLRIRDGSTTFTLLFISLLLPIILLIPVSCHGEPTPFCSIHVISPPPCLCGSPSCLASRTPDSQAAAAYRAAAQPGGALIRWILSEDANNVKLSEEFVHINTRRWSKGNHISCRSWTAGEGRGG